MESLEQNDLRSKVKVMIGVAPLSQAYYNKIGVDGFAPDASAAVTLVKN